MICTNIYIGPARIVPGVIGVVLVAKKRDVYIP